MIIKRKQIESQPKLPRAHMVTTSTTPTNIPGTISQSYFLKSESIYSDDDLIYYSRLELCEMSYLRRHVAGRGERICPVVRAVERMEFM